MLVFLVFFSQIVGPSCVCVWFFFFKLISFLSFTPSSASQSLQSRPHLCHLGSSLQSLNVSRVVPHLCRRHAGASALSASVPLPRSAHPSPPSHPSRSLPPLSSSLSVPLHHLLGNDKGDRWRPDHQYHQSVCVRGCVCLIYTHTHTQMADRGPCLPGCLSGDGVLLLLSALSHT